MPAKRPAPIRVLVVDDHRTFAEALAWVLESREGFETRAALTGEEALAMSAVSRPDVVLMDAKMPHMGGIEAIRRLREQDPSVRIIMLSAFEDDLLKGQALEAGAIGYVSKETPLTELPALIRAAQAGEALLDRREAVRLLRVLHHRRHQDATERMRANRLTPRQIEILQMMADGIPTQDIADQLDMSPLTLRTHVQNILTRLGVHRKEEALVLAIRHGKITARG
jgi:DNA-binding NarL/FixJ family response regulator